MGFPIFVCLELCSHSIAVSGGPDSMALCILTARWWQQQQQVKWVSHGVIEEAASGMMLLLLSNHVGMVVDHGLHPESVVEALSVQHWLARLGEFFLLLDPELFPSLCCTLFFFFFIFFHTSSSSLAHTFCELRLQQSSGPLDKNSRQVDRK
ncbi:unnamed protein product [Sphagnum troendelagicum]|uniref:Secreted protein n=1 Tax=Sphagnum troendelagicum TaxID=128251 RepID=A0ABP0TIF7_9BRYO